MVYTFKPAPVDYIQCCQLHLCPKCKKTILCVDLPLLANDFKIDFDFLRQ